MDNVRAIAQRSGREIAQLTEPQLQDLLQLYRSAWWSQERTLEDVRKMLRHSDIIVGLCDAQTQRLLAFGRVLTDYVYRAVIFDIVVEPSHRGQGLGKAVVGQILDHPDLQEVEAFWLACLPDMVPFYQKWGFSCPANQMQLMGQKRQKDEG